MKIYNGTPHEITIRNGCDFDNTTRKYTGGTAITRIPSDGILNARLSSSINKELDGVPYYKSKVEGCDPLPDGYDVYIVSALYATAYKATGGKQTLHTVYGLVVGEDGRTPIGCLGLQEAL